MISCQLFTQTAVATVMPCVGTFFRSVGSWLTSRMDMMIFIYAFAWFSSIVRHTMRHSWERKKRPRSIFRLPYVNFHCLHGSTCHRNYGRGAMDQSSFAVFFNNPLLAGLYLSMPYLLMLALEIHSRKSWKKRKNLKRLQLTI